MNYEFILKAVIGILGSAGLIIGVTKVVIAYIQRNNVKKIIIKRDKDDYEFILEGYTITETEDFFKKISKMIRNSDKPTILLNPEKD
jgi:hypothetical protein